MVYLTTLPANETLYGNEKNQEEDEPDLICATLPEIFRKAQGKRFQDKRKWIHIVTCLWLRD
jgi:hypothetical protein